MKTSIGRRSVNDDKISRRLELVSSLRSVSNKPPKSHRRYRIGYADDLFAGHRCSVAKRPLQKLDVESETGSDLEKEPAASTGFSQTDLTVGLAAIAGLTLGYLIGRRRK